MKIYIAAPWPTRSIAINVMGWLEAQGHYVTSRWLKDVEDQFALDQQHIYAQKSLADVREADLLLALNGIEWKDAGTGGRHVELGYAIALKKQIVLVGVRTNVFHYLDCVRVISRLEDL